MKYPDTSQVELIKLVLLNVREPGLLNDHPWAILLSGPKEKAPGARLVELVTCVFRKTIPPGPPRAGKRLDTRWGAFGILAAQHFAPLLYGTPIPGSQREAWASLDRSILFFVYGRAEGLSPDELARYRFAEDESEPAPNSTLSDWHRKGMEQLSEAFLLELRRRADAQKPRTKILRFVKQASIILVLIFLLLSALLGWKIWGLYQRALLIEQQARGLADYLHPTPLLAQIPGIATQVHTLHTGLDALISDTAPLLWMAPYFGWLPRYGGEISQAENLLALAQNLVTAADAGLTAITPAIETTIKNNQSLDVLDLVLKLQNAGPELLDAQLALTQAQAARAGLNLERLSPAVKQIITGRIDPLFETITGTFPMDDALSLIRIAPKLLGVGKSGPQTYLILIQNEDELRPTGGFLTAAGSVVVMDGKLIGMNIESAELIDDYSKPYPLPPWQFQTFMNIGMLMFRDSNWFTNFPTTVSWAEYLYCYTRAASADGVIAIDSHVIVQLLKTLGPIRVEKVNYPITSENVMAYMRSAKESAPPGFTGNWDRKQFIERLARPLLEKILQSRGRDWTKLVPVLLELLTEKHILMQFDDEEAARLLERHNWDGAVRIPTHSDFNMLVDANMSYNKSNPSMEVALDYSLNLADIKKPTSLLTVRQTNHSSNDIPCLPRYSARFIPSQTSSPYVMEECYWGYLRLYLPAGAQLLRSTPRAIPAESTMLGEAVPARTDDLASEDIPNAQVYGTMTMVPTHSSISTEFEFLLPPDVLTWDGKNNLWVYHLKLQKQPGALTRSLRLRLQLPPGAAIENASLPLLNENNTWTALLDLRNDLLIEVPFRLK